MSMTKAGPAEEAGELDKGDKVPLGSAIEVLDIRFQGIYHERVERKRGNCNMGWTWTTKLVKGCLGFQGEDSNNWILV
jgi:hypothetical protein